MVAALAVGALGGALNGFLVTQLGLPSIAVTIGTLTLFRGIAEIILGQGRSPVSRPRSPTSASRRSGHQLAYSIVIFVVLAAIFGVVLHGTRPGARSSRSG